MIVIIVIIIMVLIISNNLLWVKILIKIKVIFNKCYKF